MFENLDLSIHLNCGTISSPETLNKLGTTSISDLKLEFKLSLSRVNLTFLNKDNVL